MSVDLEKLGGASFSKTEMNGERECVYTHTMGYYLALKVMDFNPLSEHGRHC